MTHITLNEWFKGNSLQKAAAFTEFNTKQEIKNLRIF